jgi:hypothetical protein
MKEESRGMPMRFKVERSATNRLLSSREVNIRFLSQRMGVPTQ